MHIELSADWRQHVNESIAIVVRINKNPRSHGEASGPPFRVAKSTVKRMLDSNFILDLGSRVNKANISRFDLNLVCLVYLINACCIAILPRNGLWLTELC
jgi:hypothetical protein